MQSYKTLGCRNIPNLQVGNTAALSTEHQLLCTLCCCTAKRNILLATICKCFQMLFFSDLHSKHSDKMSANKKLKNLLQASEAVSHSSTCQHIVLSVSSDGKVHAAGSDNLVTGLVSDVELYRKAKACIKSHATEESDGYATTHTHLPCSPSSAGWKQLGTHTVRGILKDMLVCAGYGR